MKNRPEDFTANKNLIMFVNVLYIHIYVYIYRYMYNFSIILEGTLRDLTDNKLNPLQQAIIRNVYLIINLCKKKITELKIKVFLILF